MAGDPDSIHALATQQDNGEPWQLRGACAQVGALDEYDVNPFDVASLDSIDLDLIQEINDTFCHQCPVWLMCQNWATEDTNYKGIAAGKLFGVVTGRKAVPISEFVSRKRKSAT